MLPDLAARPGAWRNDYAAFQVGILDAFGDPSIPEVVVMKPTQSGISQAACNFLSQLIDLHPCAAGLVQPTEDDLKDFIAQKLLPMIESTPRLRRKVKTQRRGEAGGTTTTRVTFPGGFIQGMSASSAAALQSKSLRALVGDEVDEWPESVGKGGDPLLQLIARLRTFWDSMIRLMGKPTIAGRSRIEKLYRDSDQRKYHVPCPACGLEQVLRWDAVRWPENQPGLALMHCTGCDHGMNDQERMDACRRGRWIATNPGPKRVGFHFPSWVTPWVRSLGDLAERFVAAKRAGPEQLQVFVNSEMAETWTEAGEQLKPDDLEGRAEDYSTEPLPAGVVVLTVGGDVQADRVEIEVVGWGADRERWSVDYFVVRGDPDSPLLWAEVDALLQRRWKHAHGYSLGISAACIDSGGHHTQAVYRFCTPRAGRRIYAVKGRGGKVPIWAKAEKRRNIRERAGAGHLVHIVGVDTAKEAMYHALRRVAEGAGYCHLPRRYPTEWFDQLTAEERVQGRKGIEWHRKGSQPNEAWDCCVYSLAALESLLVGGLDLNRLAEVRAAKGVAETAPGMYPSGRTGRRVRSAGIGG